MSQLFDTFNMPFAAVYDNDVSAFIPELWAQESLAILRENMVAANLVNRDFENTLARFGQTVHTRRPGEFKATRKGSTDDVTVQDVTATDVTVTLNQLAHISFMIRDADQSYAFKDLVPIYIQPAMLDMARFVDQVLLGQYAQFMMNATGQLGGLNPTNAKASILNARNVLNKNKAYMQGRNFIWTPSSETSVLNTDIFVQANTVGDGGQAMREAILGRKLGFDHYTCQNMASIDASTTDTVTGGAINYSGGYVKGSTALTVDGLSAAIANGQWVTINGDPHRVVSTTGGSTPTVINIATGARIAYVDNDVILVYGKGTVNNSGGYPAGYIKEIAITGFTNFPQVGQMVTFQTSTTSPIYTIVRADPTNGEITLDRPLVSSLSNSDQVNIGPAGDFNLAFCKDALALVVRPLPTPQPGIGAQAAVVNDAGLSIRACLSYNGTKQGILVTLDMLFGVAVLDTNLATVQLG